MNHREYTEYTADIPFPEGLGFSYAVMWLNISRLPLALISIGENYPAVVRIPPWVINRYGISVPVISMSAAAFAGKTDITDIILPPTVRSIPDGAFAGCTSLKNITIPRSVRRIGEGTFRDCRSLENAYYEGTLDEWKKLEIVYQKHEIDFGGLIPGTPVQSVTGQRLVNIPGNEALFSANIHLRCNLARTNSQPLFSIKAKGKDVTDAFTIV